MIKHFKHRGDGEEYIGILFSGDNEEEVLDFITKHNFERWNPRVDKPKEEGHLWISTNATVPVGGWVLICKSDGGYWVVRNQTELDDTFEADPDIAPLSYIFGE